jgi:NhaA family Na+:H+ antiporter
VRLIQWLPLHRIRDFMASEAAGGLVLMAVAALALVVANSPLGPDYFDALQASVGPLSVQHWINDGLMAVFFLLVGLEIKRETLDGELATWPQRTLPGVCALGGMLVPALIYVAFNHADGETLRGWAIPTATDIAFALGVLSLLGDRVPVSLKIFLTALAIIDDLGAVLIIAIFYTSALSLPYLFGALAVVVLLVAMNRYNVRMLWPYLLLGAILWVLVLQSGIHATLAGVALALTLPLDATGSNTSEDREANSPLLRMEHALHRVVPFVIIPIFGFANAGLSFASIGVHQLVAPLTLGVAGGLLAGKLIGVFGIAVLAVKLGFARLPVGANWFQMIGIAALCGIGFTMSLFISALAFANHTLIQEEVKLGILGASLIAGTAGWLVLRFPAGSDTG